MKTINNKKRKVEIILFIVIMLISPIIVSILIQGYNIFSSFHHFIKYTSIGWTLGFTGWIGNSTIKYYTVKKLDWTKNPKKANTISLLMYIVFGLIYCPLIPYLYDIWWEVSPSEIRFDVFVKGLMIFSLHLIFVLMFYSTQLSNHWMKSIRRNEELKRENLQAKYEVLKNKVNPHFLFNSLNTLSSVIERKPALGSDFVKKLSDIYRYVLEQSDKELVSLDVEMKFVEDYIFLSKKRFGNALTFHSTIPGNTEIQVVPLGLQTLVENAIKHNIISDDMPLHIEVGMEDDFIVLKNNIQKKNIIMPDRKPHGLENLRNRYTYHTDLLIEITESDEFFTVKLPIIKTKSYELLDN